MRFFSLNFLLLAILASGSVLSRPFWEEDLNAIAGDRLVITIPAGFEAALLANHKPLQFHGFSAQSKRFEPAADLIGIVDRSKRELLGLLEENGNYQVIFIKKEETLNPDFRAMRFLLPLVRIEGNNYTLLNIQKQGGRYQVEAEMREQGGLPGPYIRFELEKIYFLFQ